MAFGRVAKLLMCTVLFQLTHVVLSDTPERNMGNVWKHICEFYSQNSTPTQYTSLGLMSFCAVSRPYDRYPCLKGKGAEAKDLLPAIRDIWKNFAREHPDYDLVLGALSAMAEVQDILGDYPRDLFIPLPCANALLFVSTMFCFATRDLLSLVNPGVNFFGITHPSIIGCGTGLGRDILILV